MSAGEKLRVAVVGLGGMGRRHLLALRGLPGAAFRVLIASVQQLNAPPAMLSDEYRYKILRLLEADPEMSQRDIARALGVSLGKVNYCLQALIDTGLVKANNFKNSQHKQAYMYLLTRKGFAVKARASVAFLQRKVAEYEALRREIEILKREVTH